MKGYRGIGVLFFLFLLLGAYVYFAEFKGAQKREKKESEQKKVLLFEKTNIENLTLIFPDRKMKFSRVGDNQWKMIEPLIDEADPLSLNNIVNDLHGLLQTREFTGEEYKPDAFKLDKPSVEVRIKIVGFEEEKVLKIGREAPSGSSLYVQREGESRAFLVPSHFKSTLNKTVKDLRDPVVITFKRNELSEFQIKTPKLDLSFLKGSSWKVVKPFEAEASEDSISDYFFTLEELRANEFHDKKTNAKSFLEVKLGKDKTLSFLQDSSQKIYVKKSGRDFLLELDSHVKEKLLKDLYYFREKKVFIFNRFDVNEIEVSFLRKQESYAFAKKEKGWEWTDKKLKDDRINNLLNSLLELEVAQFLDEKGHPEQVRRISLSGLEKPSKIIALRDKEGKNLLKLLIGKEKDKNVYVKTEKDPRIYLVSNVFLKNIPENMNEWVEFSRKTDQNKKD